MLVGFCCTRQRRPAKQRPQRFFGGTKRLVTGILQATQEPQPVREQQVTQRRTLSQQFDLALEVALELESKNPTPK